MEIIKVSMFAKGGFEVFEVTLESIAPVLAFEKRLQAPCIVRVTPEELYESLKLVCNGQTLFGHIPYCANSMDMIATPVNMLNFLQSQGYEVRVSPEYEQCKVADEMPLTQEQKREKLAFEAEHAGVVY
ncbi:hypothetical protein [Shewanella colwelliana]|uniref:hypothetical protein n=1 Tax=Shewanella colwelliana TaxID=23 RepID=UPI00048B7665|nr:hypothetical protein [Shewanella colwelliana]